MGGEHSTCGKGTEVANFDFRDFRNTHRFRSGSNGNDGSDLTESLPYFGQEDKSEGYFERKWSWRWSMRRKESFGEERRRSL